LAPSKSLQLQNLQRHPIAAISNWCLPRETFQVQKITNTYKTYETKAPQVVICVFKSKSTNTNTQ
jgi:hypothetical protein